MLLLAFQELDKEALRRTTVAPGLDEDIDHIAVLIDRTPEILPLAVGRDEDFVQKPRLPDATLTSFQCPRLLWTEFQTPLSNGFVGNDAPAFGEQIFHIAETQGEPSVVPEGVADDFRPIAVFVIEGSMAFHRLGLPPAA